MKPYFIGLGAQKCGTSWIYANLDTHPEIHIPIKEIHFFSREYHFSKGIIWYEAFYKRCGKTQKCGEFCTSYLFSEMAAERIFHFYPEIKLIATLRNPVDRAFSNFKNDVMAGNVNKGVGFFNALDDHPEYIEQGQYSDQLERFLKYFSMKNMCVMIYEDIKKDPQLFMKKIYAFLDVRDNFTSRLLHEKINPSYVPRSQVLERVMSKVSSKLKHLKGGNIFKSLKRVGINKVIRGMNRNDRDNVPVLKHDERKKLFQYFGDSIIKLEKLLEREIPEWKI
jgi:hypothetical protein